MATIDRDIQVVENLQSIKEQGGTFDDARDYLQSIGEDPSRFLESDEPEAKPDLLTREIQRAREFEGTIVGKIIESPKKLFGLKTRSELLKELQEVKKEGVGATLLWAIGDSVKETAKFAPAAAAGVVGKGLKLAGRLGALTGGAKFAVEATENKDLGKAALEGLKEGSTAAAVSLGMTGLTRLFAPILNSSSSFISEVVSSVPQRHYDRALQKELAGRSIFKGKWNPDVFDDLGKKAQEGLNFVVGERGQAVGSVEKLLRKTTTKVDVKPIVDTIDDFIAEKTVGTLSKLSKKDLKMVNEIKNQIRRNPNLASLDVIKSNINDLVKFDPQSVKKPGTVASSILKKTRRSIKEIIEENQAEVKAANQAFKQAANLRNRLRTKLKDENVARNLKNLVNKDATTQDLFRELDEVVPAKFKFMDKLEDAIAREPFERLFPGQFGGSGSAQGFANVLRSSGIVATGAQAGLLPAIALAAVSSPKAQKQLIQLYPKFPKAVPVVGAKAITAVREERERQESRRRQSLNDLLYR